MRIKHFLRISIFLSFFFNLSAPVAQTEESQLLIPEINFSIKGGFYTNSLSVSLESPGAVIYYSVDGSKPSKESHIYNKPIIIKKTTVLRAVAYKAKKRSLYSGQTYFINEPTSTFPVISIAASPIALFDHEKGILMEGMYADTGILKIGANFWTRKELMVHTDVFETNGENIFSSASGLRVFGGMSRTFPQKSLTIIAREPYGEKRIKYPIFGKDGLKKFKYLVLRNAGSDFGKTHFRDAFMTSLVQDWDLDIQDYRPAQVYINGKYWGILNIREKLNRYYIAGHHHIDKDSIDLIEHKDVVKNGSIKHYEKMLQFLRKNNLSDDLNYAYLQTQMDVQNYMDYAIAQIYFDNQDAGGNIKYWRPQTPEGRWRWMLFDTDWGFGKTGTEAYKNNSLAFHTEPKGPAWPNPEWSTFILRKLLENKEFKKKFINRFADHLNASFAPETVVAKLDSFKNLLLPEIDRHIKRWKLSKDEWYSQINIMKNFGINRPIYIRQYISNMLQAGTPVSIKIQPQQGGKLIINQHINIDNKGFTGVYFNQTALNLEAVPDVGYRFSHWEGIQSNSRIIVFSPQEGMNIKAIFEPYQHPLANRVIINEISANNKKSGDWVEIYNNSGKAINMQNWVFSDGEHEFNFPDLMISNKDYIIVCEDTSKFHKVFPKIYNVIGNFGFGINKHKEDLLLFSRNFASIDAVTYEAEPLDSVFTVGLMVPYLDNNDPENWTIQNNQGTPGSANDYYVSSSIRNQQDIWLRVGCAFGFLLISFLLFYFKKQE